MSNPAQTILDRRKVRRSFEAWCRHAMAKLNREPAKHHLLIIHTIEKLLRNELPTRNVMFLMPPGSAKSTYTSVLLPGWFCNPEQFPNDLMLACSYSYNLVEGFGKRARDMVVEEGNVLDISLNKAAAASGDWRTTRGGGYFCAGVNAGIAGHRAKLALIDDYLGTEEEADSQLIRDKNWDWYWNDFWPRLVPDAFQIIIANRRHEDDLVGRLLADDPGNWTVISLPMIAEQNDSLGRQPGERLWPEWFTEEQVRLARKRPRTWAGLYQQRPAPEEGNYFDVKSIVEYRPDDLPKDLRIYAASDWSVRKHDLADYTCHLFGGLDPNGRLWILPDWFWEQTDTLTATNKMFEKQLIHKPICWWHGKENITGAIGPFINLQMRERNVYIPIDELSEAKDKETKAAAIKARMSAGMVMFPGFATDWSLAKHQLLTFPGGTNDDFVDTLAKFGIGLDKMVPAKRTASPWNGIISTPPLTCGWMQRSSIRRERRLKHEQYN